MTQEYRSQPRKIFQVGVVIALTLTAIGFLIAIMRTDDGANPLLFFVFILVIATLTFIAFDKRVQSLIHYVSQLIYNYFYGLFYSKDPLKELDEYQEEMQENLDKMKQQLNKLRFQLHTLNELIYNNARGVQENISIASECKSNGDEPQTIIHMRRASRLKESNKRLSALYKKILNLYNVVQKVHDNSLIYIDDINGQIELKKKEQAAIISGHSVIQSASDILKDKENTQGTLNDALEHLTEDVSHKIGEIESFMQLSDSFMNQIDLEQGVDEEKGAELLKKWEKSTENIIKNNKDKLELLDEVIGDDSTLDDLKKKNDKKKEFSRKLDDNPYDTFFNH